MWYVIEGHDGEGALARRGEHRPAHLARLQQLCDEDRLLVGVPCPASMPKTRARPASVAAW